MSKTPVQLDAEISATTLRLLRLSTCGRSGALFVARKGRPQLVVSEALDQAGLDDAAELWAHPPLALLQGTAFRGSGKHEFLALPCLVGDALHGLAYIEIPEEGAVRLPADMAAFVGVLRATLLDTSAHAPADTTVDAEGVNLVFLLERHEWNVARVARLLGVTRMTIYNRMRRHGIPRRRVRRTRRRLPRTVETHTERHHDRTSHK